MTPRSLIAAVKKTFLRDDEAQQLIDILLNKQSGSGGSGSNEWTSAGSSKAAGGGSGGLAELKKQLESKTTALADQEAAVKSLADRLNVLRAELNASKGQLNSAQRVLDDAHARHQHEVEALKSRLASGDDQHQRDVQQLQAQIAQFANHNQALQITVDQQNAQMQTLQYQQVCYTYALHNLISRCPICFLAIFSKPLRSTRRQ